MDLVGFLWFGVVTGVGGGTVHDVQIDAPAISKRDASPAIASPMASQIVYFTAHHISSRYRAILWLQALGIPPVTTTGTNKYLEAGTAALVAVAMGVITPAVGGIIRDVIGQEPSIILRREVYVTACLLGAVICVALTNIGVDRLIAGAIGGFVVFLVRGLAISLGWSLPTYRARPGKPT